ncbi:hypothetical protein [Deinococcus maricopensis]|uniref:Uncharacterized protein n=1 Tax=Deinococcus maricopensis (strain DSM 21211 / LMG 22137 / NRRL B-23946 / LB-34) TaxID=709986 RepID=E8U7B8_DEIML|nr:hypothetical protein [Deinococcus maricopensis]ADV66957.1 hypothetical protein Deima_1306 [Deinococcus maricopensis DSM 21211]
MSDNRYGDAPLGRSVEDVEQDNENLVNSSLQGEDVRSRDDGLPAAVIPIPSGPSGSAVPAVIANPDRLDGRGDAGPNDGRGGKQTDTSE